MHALLEPILDETYGIMIYQEQVQQAARDLAGYTLGGADLLRRAMGKKIKEEMDEQREIFINGASENDIDNRLASDIFDQIASFAGYGFNKSHAAAYALVCYQTAWLKANHPVDFLAASMALDAGNTDKLAVFRQDCLYKEISVLPRILTVRKALFLLKRRISVTGLSAMHWGRCIMSGQRRWKSWSLSARKGEYLLLWMISQTPAAGGGKQTPA